MSSNNNNSAAKKPTQPTGTTDSPYLGSKISLVSKAKIRYEGILYTIDANESTVALSKVRSFGTEGRPTDRPVPARDEIFEYIIFRGADIEDLQVREPPQSALTQDPAIVESSMHPSTARSTTAPTSSNTNANNPSGNQSRSSGNQGTFFSSSSPSSAQQGPNRGAKPSSAIDPLRQLNFNQQQSTRSFDNQRRFRQQDYPNDNSNRRGNNQKYDNYAEWPRTNNTNSGWENNYRQQNQRYPRQQQQQQQQQQNYEGNRFYPSRRTNNNNNNNQQSNGYYGYRQRRNSTGGIGGNRQQRDRADSTRGNTGTSQSALKFIGDFDFEKSNAEFDKNAIEDELKKSLSIKTNKDANPTAATNEQENNEEPEQQNIKVEPEQQQQQQEQQEQDQEGNNPEGFYDKQKSFFDRISCETTEKEKTSNSRRNWNEERRINAETFGLKYRPNQPGGNQRNSQNGGGGGGGGYYNNNNRRYNSGQQSYYGNNGARYQRGGSGSQQQRGRNNNNNNDNNYYGNSNRRMQAY